MHMSQAVNLFPQGGIEASKTMRNNAREAKQGMFEDVMNKQMSASSPKTHGADKGSKANKAAEQAPADEQPLTEQEDNLYVFPTVVNQEIPEDIATDTIWIPDPQLLELTTALVSILEGYPNNTPPDTEVVPLLEEYAQKLSQLEQPLTGKAAELQTLIEEVLARTPQNQDIEGSTQQTDKLAEIVKLLRGNPSPLENVNEDNSNKLQADAPETETSLLKPVVSGEQTTSADTDSENHQQHREQKSVTNTTATQAQTQTADNFRVDVAPQKVFFADHMQAAQGTARFVPMTPESLFNTMIDRIVALPGADPHMEIALKPDHLGKLTIDLSLGEQGLTAKIVASDEGVRNMLAAHVNRLSETLAEKGIRVENVEIVYSSMADKQSDQRESAQQEQGKNNSYRQPLWGAVDSITGSLDNAYLNSPYMDEWGMSSVEYQA